MRHGILLSAAMVGLIAGQAGAATLDIRYAAASVTIIPEARSDIAVSIGRANARLPLRITRSGNDVTIDGGLHGRLNLCKRHFGRPGVWVWGVGGVDVRDLPQVIVRTPMNVSASVGEAVFGAVGRANSVDLRNRGCGDWTVADVAGPLTVNVAGSGDVRTGRAASGDLRVSGSGDIATQAIAGGLNATTAGSGDISAASVNGPFHARVVGSGDVRAGGGQVTDMDVQVAGSGDVRLAGTAQSLKANVAGSGDITVSRVIGPVVKHVAGSGDVRIGT